MSDSAIHLYLSDNSLSGTLPSRVGSMVQLRTLQLNRNPITGGLPSWTGERLSTVHLCLYVPILLSCSILLSHATEPRVTESASY